jgi:hypothetical protein
MPEVTIPELVRALAEDMPLTSEDCSELAQRLLRQFAILRRPTPSRRTDHPLYLSERME